MFQRLIRSPAYRIGTTLAVCAGLLGFSSAISINSVDYRFQNLLINGGGNITFIGTIVGMDADVEVFVPSFFREVLQCQSGNYSACPRTQQSKDGGSSGGDGGGGGGPMSTPITYTLDFTKGEWKSAMEFPYAHWLILNNAWAGAGISSFKLICDTGSPTINGVAPSFAVWPYSADYMSDFLGIAFNVSDPSKQVLVSKNKLVTIIMISQDSGQGGQKMVLLENAQKLMSDGKCKLSAESSVIRKVGVAGDSLVKIEVATLNELPAPPCDYQKLLQVISSFEAYLTTASSSASINDIGKSEGRISLLLASSAFQACNALLDAALVKGTLEQTATSTECAHEYGTLEFAGDVCCNRTLSFTSCCAPRAITKNVQSLIGINAEFIARECIITEKNVLTLLGTLDGYIASTKAINDPATGCSAMTAKLLGNARRDYSTVWNKYLEFASTCQTLLTSRATCTTDSDCYTSCAKNNGGESTCVVPDDPTPLVMKCFADKMSAEFRKGLMVQWGLTNATDNAALIANMYNRTTSERCVGPESYSFNGGWYQGTSSRQQCSQSPTGGYSCTTVVTTTPKPVPVSVDERGVPTYKVEAYTAVQNGTYSYCQFWGSDTDRANAGCFYLPPSKEACLSVKKCNYYRWDMYQSPCETDYLDDGGNMCGNCFGGSMCQDVSVKGGCKINIPGDIWSVSRTSPNWNATVDACKAAGGKLWSMPLGVNTYNAQTACYLPATTDQATCTGYCTGDNGPKPVIPKACISRTMDAQTCNNFGANNPGLGAWLSYADNAAVCRAYAWDSNTCSTQYGAKGFSWQNVATTPETIAQEQSNQCRFQRCFSKTLTKAACQLKSSVLKTTTTLFGSPTNYYIYFNWDENLNNGAGYCNARTDYKNAESDCTGLGDGFTYFKGYDWNTPQFDTKERCDYGYCSVPQKMYLDPATCAATSYCTRYCQKCTKPWWSASSSDSICFHTDQAKCTTDSAISTWTTITPNAEITNATAVCLYTGANTDACSKIQGASVLRCGDISSKSCGAHPFQNSLSCYTNYESCPDQTSCYNAGWCNDWDVASGWYNRTSNQYISTEGSCLLKPKFDYGYADCSAYYTKYDGVSWANFGCTVASINKADCATLGGEYVKKATSPSTCGVFKGCCEKGANKTCNPWELTPKSETECTKCGGVRQPYHQWNGGQFTTGSMTKLTWAKRGVVVVNKWALALDFNLFYNAAHNAIGSIVADIMARDAKCKMSPIITAMKNVACTCGTNVGVECGLASGGSVTTLDSGVLTCGSETSRSLLGAFVNIPIDGVSNCTRASGYTIGTYAGTPGGSDIGTTTAKRNVITLGRRATIDASCYVLVQNSNNAYVGQLLGDCVDIKTSSSLKNVELCMATKSTIPQDSATYPTYGVALRTVNSQNKDVYTAQSGYTPIMSNGQLCITVNAAGSYCPIALKSTWSTETTGSQPSCSSGAATLAAINTAAAALTAGATQIKITVQPSAKVASGVYFDPPIQVEFQDANNALVSAASATVTLSLVANDNNFGASVIGTARVAAVKGVATFKFLSVDLVGTGYQLFATSGASLQSTASTAFEVTPGQPAAVSFSQQPGGCVNTWAWLQNPIVQVVDAQGNAVPTAVPIQLTLTTSAGSNVAFTAGSTTGTTVATTGEAEFTGLTVASTYTGVYLTATSAGLSTAISVTFAIVPPNGYPVSLLFMLNPSGVSVSALFVQEPLITVVDGYGNAVSSSVKVSMRIMKNTGTKGAVLGGTTTVTSVGSTAQYTDLTISRAGKDYRLLATSNGLVNAKSTAFNVNGAYAIAFVSAPTGVVVGKAFSISVNVLDISNAVMVSSSEPVTLALKPFSGPANAALQGIVTVSAVNGVATFTDLQITVEGVGFQIIASAKSGSLLATTDAFVVAATSGATTTGSLSTAAIAGIVAGSVALIAICAVVFLRSRARKVGVEGKN